MADQAKRYCRQKYTLYLIDTVYTLVLLFVFLGLGLAVGLENLIAKFLPASYLLLPVFLLFIFILYFVCSFPLNFYRSYILEHKFVLSKQSLGDWFLDQLKSGVVAYIIAFLLIAMFFSLVIALPRFWWLGISVFWIFFSFVLARLAPVVIMPLFFKFKPLTDELLKNRIIGLAKKMRIDILDVFQIDFSKKSLKANAAFTGMGKTRRGGGLVEELALEGQVDIQMGTLSKAAGSFGAYVCGTKVLRDYLINKSRSFIYTTAMPPSLAQASRAALQIIRQADSLRRQLQLNANYLRGEFSVLGFDTMNSSTPIIPILVKDPLRAVAMSQRLLGQGIFVQAIRPPTVPMGTARLRLTVMATHTQEDLDQLLKALRIL